MAWVVLHLLAVWLQLLQHLAQLWYLEVDQRGLLALSEYLVIFWEVHQHPENQMHGVHRQIKTAYCRLYVSYG